MGEKFIEKKLVLEVKKKGGICPKFVSPGFDGMPDRIILAPNGKVAFAELKSKGRRAKAQQILRHRLLRNLGFKVYLIDDVEQIGGVLDEILST